MASFVLKEMTTNNLTITNEEKKQIINEIARIFIRFLKEYDLYKHYNLTNVKMRRKMFETIEEYINISYSVFNTARVSISDGRILINNLFNSTIMCISPRHVTERTILFFEEYILKTFYNKSNDELFNDFLKEEELQYKFNLYTAPNSKTILSTYNTIQQLRLQGKLTKAFFFDKTEEKTNFWIYKEGKWCKKYKPLLYVRNIYKLIQEKENNNETNE